MTRDWQASECLTAVLNDFSKALVALEFLALLRGFWS